VTSLGTGRQTLADRYELQDLIATGGMGQVWRACDRLLERPVAVKVLRSEYADDPVFLERFRCEARHAASLSHPNIAAVLDYGETRDAGSGERLAYLVMELVEGAPLSVRLEADGPLPPEDALSVLRQTAAGLAEAHRAGLVHRDVKPANILVRPDGRVKLTDFGIAWSADSVPLTRTGQVVGTAQYMSPEQATGERVGPATDVYALGLVGYESLAGRPAFAGTNPVAVALKQLREDPAPLPGDLPPVVRDLIDAALVKDPRERPHDAAAFLSAVEETIEATTRAGTRPEPAVVPPTRPVLPGLPLVGEPTETFRAADLDEDPAERSAVGARHRRALLLVPLAVLLVGVLAVLLWPGSSGTGRPPTAQAAEPTSGTDGGAATAASVVLAASDHVGRPARDVAGDLTSLGLTVTEETEETTAVRPGTVAGLDPVGVPLPPAAGVTIRVAVAPAAAVRDTGPPTGDGGGVPGAPAQTLPDPAPEAVPSDAVPSDAVPSDAVPSDAVPSGAVPTEQVPSDPAPADVVPADPAPADVVPADPAPAEPSDAAPVQPAPSEPATPEPVTPEPAPADLAPADPAPADPAPAEPSDAAPSEPAAEPAPPEPSVSEPSVSAPSVSAPSGSAAPAPSEPAPAG
jgi:serine/threonine-protein kinase